jgi:hypothetical protein
MAFFREMADPTLIFSGDRAALLRFASLLRQVAADPPTRGIELDQVAPFVPGLGTKVLLEVTDKPSGMRRIPGGEQGNRFSWAISPAMAMRFAELITAVAEASRPVHHYLDSDSLDEVTALVSSGEYSDETFDR